MNTDLEKLARRGAACPKWRWVGGMQIVHSPEHDGATGYLMRLAQDGYVPAANEYADLSDPATLGCLLALVRKAWGVGSYPLPDGGWYVKGARLKNGGTINLGICATTEAEALIAALEAAK